MGEGIERCRIIPEGVNPLQASWRSLLVSRNACPAFQREWFAVKQALKEARLQSPVLTPIKIGAG